MFLNQVFDVDIIFLGNIVDGKIMRFPSNFGCSSPEKSLEIEFLQEENVEDTCKVTHDTYVY